MPDVWIPEREERSFQDNATRKKKKGKFIADSTQGSRRTSKAVV